jgi:hypothetical protein
MPVIAMLALAKIQKGFEAINAEPDTEEAAHAQLAFRRQLVEGIMSRVDVRFDKTIRVQLTLDFGLELVADQSQLLR